MTVTIKSESRVAACTLVRIGSVGCFTCRTAVSTWDTVSINKGESILAYDTLVKVRGQTDFTGLMAISTFVCTVRSHPFITTATSSVSLIVGVCYTVLTFVGIWS